MEIIEPDIPGTRGMIYSRSSHGPGQGPAAVLGRTQCDVTDVSICVGNTGPGAGQVEIERAQLMACHEARWQLVMRPGTRPQLSRDLA